jgi:hypothetical protein
MSQSRARLLAAAVSLAGLATSACGSNSLSTAQLRTRATHACTATNRRLERIPVPEGAKGAYAFLSRGVSALQPEIAALRRLHPGGSAADRYGEAFKARSRELAALESSLKSLRAGNDPVVTVKTLEHQLLPLERRAASAWRALGIEACVRS